MAIIQPFKAVRPVPELAAKVAALPYDVMNSAEAHVMAKNNPHSFLHVSKAEIDFPEGIDIHSQQVYDKAFENFNALMSGGILMQDTEAHLYIYAQTMSGRRQVGVVACSSVEDYFNGIIKKHEFTRPEKELDRIHHMQTLGAHVGPIFLTYPDNKPINELVAGVVKGNPLYDFTAEDGVQHSVWMIDEAQVTNELVRLFREQVPFTYIADGHHRTASAAKVGKELREKNADHKGHEEYNYFLSVLFPASELAIMDYNRLVKDLNGHSSEAFMTAGREKFEISALNKSGEAVKPVELHTFSMYLSGTWYRLHAKQGTYTTDPIGVLDVTILQNNLLTPLLGIDDPRTNTRIDFVGGIRGMQELERRVDNGEMKVAFALYPVSLQQLIDIADSGNVMPPKSTWFEPKLRDGLFSHLF